MKATRRGFLSFLGGAAAAGPQAAKAAAESAAMDLAGVSVGSDPFGLIGNHATPERAAGGKMRSLASALRDFGVPDAMRQKWKREARDGASRAISADLAVLRSVSLTAKISIQADRNYRDLERDAFDETRWSVSEWFNRHVYGIEAD